jgi:hypothetical protein
LCTRKECEGAVCDVIEHGGNNQCTVNERICSTILFENIEVMNNSIHYCCLVRHCGNLKHMDTTFFFMGLCHCNDITFFFFLGYLFHLVILFHCESGRRKGKPSVFPQVCHWLAL